MRCIYMTQSSANATRADCTLSTKEPIIATSKRAASALTSSEDAAVRSTITAESAVGDPTRADSVPATPVADAEPTITAEIEPDEPDLDNDEPGVSSDPVRNYLNEIGRTPLLDAAQEVDLAKRIEAGVYAEVKLREACDMAFPPDRRDDVVERCTSSMP